MSRVILVLLTEVREGCGPMASSYVLLTGFEPYGGRSSNPAYEVMRALDGKELAGASIVGRALPVSCALLPDKISSLLGDIDPMVVLSLGLWPGEPVIRLERVATNVADFEIADNLGQIVTDQPLIPGGATSLPATLPLRQIEQALLKQGIPARLSGTAGSFLCNACVYRFLHAATFRPMPPLVGFLHLPYLPSQVADLIAEIRQEGRLELHQRADLASMDISLATRAVETTLVVSIAASRERVPRS
jgi:pyroglutamyl-peptidase